MLNLCHIGSSPELLALSILVSTFFLEDVAIGYAAFLAASGALAPPLSFASLLLGVYLGDLGLYLLGAAARRNMRIRRFIGEDRISRAGSWLAKRAVWTLIGARVVPGSRLPIYAAGGFLRLPFRIFASTTAATSLVWTAAVFSAIYTFGIRSDALFGEFKYGAALAGLLILLGAPFISARLMANRARRPMPG